MLYAEAARIIQLIDNKKGTVKSLCLQSKTAKNKKQLYAVVCETLKYRKVIREIIKTTKLIKLERALSQEVAELLVHDFLFGRGIHGAPKKLKDAIEKHKSALKSELARHKIKAKVTKNKDLLSDAVKNGVALPRYVRVNLLKTTVADVIQHFETEDFTLVSTRGLPYGRYIEVVSRLNKRQFAVDVHIPELLVFAAKTDLHAHVLYTSGDIILQDKASCIPAHILAPPAGSHVIDCCAAPGNKTTHAASYLQNKGKIFSFDLDARRLATMGTMTLKAGVLCAQLTHQDFLTVNPADPKYARVTHAIVDPSCSGSGIVSRLNTVTDDAESNAEGRLEKLAAFQESVVCHALSFPAMQRLVYSTCSIHHQENEDVVRRVLRKHRSQFRLVHALDDMPGRGEGSFPHSEYCLRLDPARDLTNGFFVACFERIPPGETVEEEEGWSEEGEKERGKGDSDSDSEEEEEKGTVEERSGNNQTTDQSGEKVSDVTPETKSMKKRKRNKKKKAGLDTTAAKVENTNGGTPSQSSNVIVSVAENDSSEKKKPKKRKRNKNKTGDATSLGPKSNSPVKRPAEQDITTDSTKKMKANLSSSLITTASSRKKKQKNKKKCIPITA